MSRSVELSRGAARARIEPELGCAITALALGDATILRPTPAAAIAERDVRRAGCYPLVPYSNRIRDARLSFGGREYALARNFGAHPHAIHGVGWQREWTLAEASIADARFTLVHDARADPGGWPWPFDTTQTFHLSGTAQSAALAVTLTIANTGSEPFPFGLGWHPFVAIDETTRVGFIADRVWRNDDTQLPVALEPIPPDWRFDPPRALGALTLDNVFTGWRGSARIESRERALAVAVAADTACSCLVVYRPPGSDFVALEPVTNETDAFNRAAAGAAGTGMRVLPPGASFSCTMRIAAAAIAG